MGSPIRCLDEFDVFMDSVNRKMSIDMLIAAARGSVGRQFVLISPGTKEDFKRMPDVHVKEYVALQLVLTIVTSVNA
jgi:ATP-dependent RNA helicase DDX6/DHH1